MKVICDRGTLLDAINLVSGAVAARNVKPQLACVHLTASKSGSAGELTLAATDGEIALRFSLTQIDVAEPGQALVPADKLRQIVSAEDAEPTLELETDGDALHIRGQDAHFQIYGYAPADFPPIHDFQTYATGSSTIPSAKCVFEHAAGSLDQLVTRTTFATARENSRYAINGVLLKREGKKLELVATDGRRLALCRAATQGESSDAAVQCIVPTKGLTMLQKLLDHPDETVRVAISDSQIAFGLGGGDQPGRAVLTSNLVEGAFPPYQDVIPSDQDVKVHFDRDVLFSAVRRAALLTNEESRGVRLSFKGADRVLEIASRAPEMGEAQINVDLAEYEGTDIEIAFNPKFITEALRVIPDPAVTIELKSTNKPGVIKSGQDFTYVVMPVNL